MKLHCVVGSRRSSTAAIIAVTDVQSAAVNVPLNAGAGVDVVLRPVSG